MGGYLQAVTATVAVAALALGVWVWRHPPADPRAGMVTVDLIRIINAQRKALPSLNAQDSSIDLLRTGRQLMPTVQAVAGPGAVVLVKQSVVSGALPDITDAVLRRLGLPLDAPSVSFTHPAEDLPSAGNVTAGQVWQRHLEEQGNTDVQALRQRQRAAVDQTLP